MDGFYEESGRDAAISAQLMGLAPTKDDVLKFDNLPDLPWIVSDFYTGYMNQLFDEDISDKIRGCFNDVKLA